MVDAVILWVDPSDPEWLAEFNHHTGQELTQNEIAMRYRDWDTLRFVMRGIEQFLPFINKVHLITTGHVPNWLDRNKVNCHSHKDIFHYPEALPVFNSSAIELNFDNIPGLAEQFLYFNDDMLAIKQLPKSRFFKKELPVDFCLFDVPRDNAFYRWFRNDHIWTHMILNSHQLIKREFKLPVSLCHVHDDLSFWRKLKNKLFSMGQGYFFEHYHHIQPYLKRTIKNVNQLYADETKSTIKSRFREKSNVSQALYRYYHLITKDFHPAIYEDHHVYSLTTLEQVQTLNLEADGYSIVCLNDTFEGTEDEFKLAKEYLVTQLERIFPQKSLFEIER